MTRKHLLRAALRAPVLAGGLFAAYLYLARSLRTGNWAGDGLGSILLEQFLPVALLVGNEGSGLSDELQAAATDDGIVLSLGEQHSFVDSSQNIGHQISSRARRRRS